MEDLHIGVNDTTAHHGPIRPVQLNPLAPSAFSAKNLPKSTRPADTPQTGLSYLVVESDDVLVTSPTSYQDQQQQPSLTSAAVAAARQQPGTRSSNTNYDSFQYHYNPLAFSGGAGSYPPPSASSSSSFSPSSEVAAASSSDSQGASLSRAKSLAVNSSARQAMLQQQQQYQQQRQEQFLGLSQRYSNSNSIPMDAWAAAAAASLHGINNVHASAAPGGRAGGGGGGGGGGRIAVQVSGTRIGTAAAAAGGSPPRSGSGLVPPPLAPRPNTPLSPFALEVSPSTTPQPGQYPQQYQQQQQQQPGERTNGIASPPASQTNGHHADFSPSSSASTTMQGRASTIQFENGHQQQQQQRQNNATLNSVLGSPLGRAGTISTASTSSIANANFISHFVPKPAPKTTPAAVLAAQTTPESSHIEDGPGPVVLLAIGKTGQGKSSLLNRIMGTNELKASASVRAVTKGIAERSGWARFEDNRRFLVTLADTPGLADTEGDDEKNIPILKDYLSSVGSRLGVTAFLLVFKINSSVDIIMTILKTFDEIMQEYPNVWENVILVFTGCDFKRDRETMEPKQLMSKVLQEQIKEHILSRLPPRPSLNSEQSFASASSSASSTSSTAMNSTPRSYTTSGAPSSSGNSTPTRGRPSTPRSATTSDSSDSITTPAVPMVFLTTAENICSFALGSGRCDCDEHSHFLKMGMKRLWLEVRKMKRWVIHSDDDEYEFSGHV